jgi:hypothetical protein|tara:strand:+ start:1070 stop:1294 length:225 start_codon:yes stop_codon:yes gene_type:complete
MTKFKKLVILISVLLYPNYSFAYFDPGTAAFIIQSLIALIGSIFIFLANPIRSIKSLLSKLKKKKQDDKAKSSK